jgi:hypothetical protein
VEDFNPQLGLLEDNIRVMMLKVTLLSVSTYLPTQVEVKVSQA